jgi:molybdopterin-guanine dinucleotide biosynthesis protein B
MKNPALFGFYGKSNSGKTTLIQRLIQQLTKNNYKVATIKKTNKKIGIDDKNKDTWKFSTSGSNLVVLSSPIETDFIIKDKLLTIEILQKIIEFGEYDVILIEGANDPTIPKIRVGDIKEISNTIVQYHNNFEEIFKLIKKEINRKIKNYYNISIWVNGKSIPLTEFPAEIIKNGILGMIKSLKGVPPIDEINIQFKEH